MIEKINLDVIKNDEIEILDPDDFLVDPDIEVPEPIPILAQGNIPIFTEDNISMIQGKAKSRKSTLIKAIGTTICKGSYGMLSSDYSRNKIAIFDTEQGKFHCWKSVKTIQRLSGHNIKYHKVSGLSPASKKQLVETHLKRNPDCGFLILDNIVHFMNDFNSATESTELNMWLIKLKGEYNCHICLVLHENGSEYGNGKAKGHIGTLLENTCETIIRVEKDPKNKSQSIVSAKAMRGIEFLPFSIEMDYQGTPFLEFYQEPEPTKKFIK